MHVKYQTTYTYLYLFSTHTYILHVFFSFYFDCHLVFKLPMGENLRFLKAHSPHGDSLATVTLLAVY